MNRGSWQAIVRKESDMTEQHTHTHLSFVKNIKQKLKKVMNCS